MRGLRVYEPVHRRPRLSERGLHLAVALVTVLLILLAGVGLALVRADEGEEEIGRFTPSARGNRGAVLERTEVETLAAEIFGAELAAYVSRIAWCESRHRPDARNAGWDRLFGAYDYRGLLQLSTAWTALAAVLTGSDDLYDPWVNLVTGRAVQQQQGWTAWPWCSR